MRYEHSYNTSSDLVGAFSDMRQEPSPPPLFNNMSNANPIQRFDPVADLPDHLAALCLSFVDVHTLFTALFACYIRALSLARRVGACISAAGATASRV